MYFFTLCMPFSVLPDCTTFSFFEQAEEIIDIGYPDQLTDGLRRVLCGHKQELCLFNAQGIEILDIVHAEALLEILAEIRSAHVEHRRNVGLLQLLHVMLVEIGADHMRQILMAVDVSDSQLNNLRQPARKRLHGVDPADGAVAWIHVPSIGACAVESVVKLAVAQHGFGNVYPLADVLIPEMADDVLPGEQPGDLDRVAKEVVRNAVDRAVRSDLF